MSTRIGPGDTVVVPPGTPHGFADAADNAFLGLSRDGRIRMPVRGLPGPLLLVALVMNRFRREIAAPGFPLFLQRAIWRALAFIGRLLGRRASFPEYGAP